MMKSLNKKYIPNEKVIYICLFILCGLIALFLSTPAESSAESPIDDISTFIPAQHVLIPLELKNAEQIDGLISSFGIIDLYQTDQLGAKAQRIAKRLKLIRAPLNPKVFGVLVHETEAELIQKHVGPFHAVVRPTESAKQAFDTKKKIQKINIEYME